MPKTPGPATDPGTADEPVLPGFGKQDEKTARAQTDPRELLATKDVMQSPFNKSGVRDSSGQEGKGFGVYRFRDKYGGNIDTYSPIYNPASYGDDLITGMSDAEFVGFMAVLTPVFLSLPLGLAWIGYGGPGGILEAVGDALNVFA